MDAGGNGSAVKIIYSLNPAKAVRQSNGHISLHNYILIVQALPSRHVAGLTPPGSHRGVVESY